MHLIDTNLNFTLNPSPYKGYGVHTNIVAAISLLINLALRFYPASEFIPSLISEVHALWTKLIIQST